MPNIHILLSSINHKSKGRPGLSIKGGFLTNKELQCLRYACLPDKAIGERIGVPWRTVAKNFESVYEKLGTKNRTQALIKALKQRKISMEEIVLE